MDFTIDFLRIFWVILKIAAPIILVLFSMIVVLGQLAGRFEKWRPAETLYWSLITASTVGYGDIHPTGRIGRILAIFVALHGLILFGVIASLAVTATIHAAQLHADLGSVQELREIIDEQPDSAGQ